MFCRGGNTKKKNENSETNINQKVNEQNGVACDLQLMKDKFSAIKCAGDPCDIGNV